MNNDGEYNNNNNKTVNNEVTRISSIDIKLNRSYRCYYRLRTSSLSFLSETTSAASRYYRL